MNSFKRLFWSLFFFALLCSPVQGEPVRHDLPAYGPVSRGMFVTSIEDPAVFSDRGKVKQLISFSKKVGVSTLFVQVFRNGQAWFPSKVADQAAYKECRTAFGEDPLAFLIREAHRSGITVHAWLNILSLGSNDKALLLKTLGPEILTRNLKPKKTLADYKIDNQYFLEPGDPRVRRELTMLVRELLASHPDLDGIQFDYIRYPDTEPHYGYTKANVDRFRKATRIARIDDGSDVWQNWKRDQVTELLRQLAKTARTLKPRLRVSTTGCMPYARAYSEAFQDWPSWVDKGIVDFVTVMNYSDDPKAFARWTLQARTKVKNFNKVGIAIGAYRSSMSPETFQWEFQFCEASGARTCAVFYYGSLLQNPALTKLLLSSQPSSAVVSH
jgi:uncharacterized lipoprotein YddW (UPF0748 family)